MTRAELARLAALADLAYRKEQADLAQRMRAADEIRARLSELSGMRAQRARVVAGQMAFDPARLGGADERWQRWIEREQAGLREVLFAAAAEAERQKLRTQLAFGKVEALDTLARRRASEVRRSDVLTNDLDDQHV